MSKKVLIAEDYTDTRRVMKLLLEMYGLDVIEATDGREAVEKALNEHPDLILMDLAMPVLDGLEATKAIRSHPELAGTPIVCVTAYGEIYREKAKRAGCNEVIHKPIDFDAIEPLVNQYMH
jgi:CheY-like chemotaxis protein